MCTAGLNVPITGSESRVELLATRLASASFSTLPENSARSQKTLVPPTRGERHEQFPERERPWAKQRVLYSLTAKRVSRASQAA